MAAEDIVLDRLQIEQAQQLFEHRHHGRLPHPRAFFIYMISLSIFEICPAPPSSGDMSQSSP